MKLSLRFFRLFRADHSSEEKLENYHRAQQIDGQAALQTAENENTDRIPFTLTFHPHAVKSIILKNLKLLQNDSETGTIFSQPLLISFKRDKDIGNFLVKSSFQTNDQIWNFQMRSLTMQNLFFRS